jgi:hypothetical protein
MAVPVMKVPRKWNSNFTREASTFLIGSYCRGSDKGRKCSSTSRLWIIDFGKEVRKRILFASCTSIPIVVVVLIDVRMKSIYLPARALPAAPPTVCPAILVLGLVLALVQYWGPFSVLAWHFRPEQQSLCEAHTSAGRRQTGCDCPPPLPPLPLEEPPLLPPPPVPLTDSRLQQIGPAFARTVGQRLVVRTPSAMA